MPEKNILDSYTPEQKEAWRRAEKNRGLQERNRQLERVADGLNAALMNMLALSRRDGMNWGPANADADAALASYAKWKEK